MDAVNVAFIGAGSFSDFVHYPSLSTMDDVRIVAIAGLDESRLKSTADKYGVEGEVYTGEQLAGASGMIRTYGYFVESREFIDCIKNDTMPLTNLSDDVKTMEFCDMISAGEHLDMTSGGQARGPFRPRDSEEMGPP